MGRPNSAAHNKKKCHFQKIVRTCSEIVRRYPRLALCFPVAYMRQSSSYHQKVVIIGKKKKKSHFPCRQEKLLQNATNASILLIGIHLIVTIYLCFVCKQNDSLDWNN